MTEIVRKSPLQQQQLPIVYVLYKSEYNNIVAQSNAVHNKTVTHKQIKAHKSTKIKYYLLKLGKPIINGKIRFCKFW